MLTIGRTLQEDVSNSEWHNTVMTVRWRVSIHKMLVSKASVANLQSSELHSPSTWVRAHIFWVDVRERVPQFVGFLHVSPSYSPLLSNAVFDRALEISAW